MNTTTPRAHSALVLPLALIAVVTVVDVLARSAILLALLAAPPALAAARGRAREVVLIGGLALLSCVAAATVNGIPTTSRSAVAYSAITAVTAAAAYASAERARAEERRLRAERRLVDVQAVADVAQGFILGPVPQRSGSLDLAVSYTSAAAGARIGGDLYEAIPTADGIRVIVGDVQGKGLAAVTTAVTVLRAFREAAPGTADLRIVADHIERGLEQRGERDEFVTAVLADCSGAGQVTVLNFGHPPPLVRGADGTTRSAEPDTPGLPLGLPFTDSEGPGTCTVRLGPGDRMLLYTDGTAEARDAAGEFFPLQDHGHLLDHPDLPSALTDLRAALTAHTGGTLDDDAAMLLLRLAPTPAETPGAEPPARPAEDPGPTQVGA
ncbi:PP2C family protein-serine/threonine phosphatase [Kitasatospora sp. NPDC059327]|uniref:PP2C family protein-serine/threonine phosphatase n=1 Tax=Kitasatospora sp. NPDC059327 TaxID=3346803 RepID=UPI00367C1234